MKSMAKWMLGAAVAVGGLGLAATPAKAAEWGVYVGGPAAYVPPCPGPGYEWVAGYYSGGYWVPGRWAFGGYHNNLVRYYGDRDRVYSRDRDDLRRRDWDHNRHDGDRWRR
jgi:hypothetical protein